jgi:hypothetical protein
MDERYFCPLCMAAVGHRSLPDDSREPLRRHLAGMVGPHRLRLEVAKSVVDALIGNEESRIAELLSSQGLEVHPSFGSATAPVPALTRGVDGRGLPSGWALEDWTQTPESLIARILAPLGCHPDPVLRRGFLQRLVEAAGLREADLGVEPVGVFFSRPIADFYTFAFAPGVPADAVADATCSFIAARYGIPALTLAALPRNDNGTYKNPAEWNRSHVTLRTADPAVVDALLRFAEVADTRADAIVAGLHCYVVLDVRLDSELDEKVPGQLLSRVERLRVLGTVLGQIIHPVLHHGVSGRAWHIALNRTGSAPPGFVGLTWLQLKDLVRERPEWRPLSRHLELRTVRWRGQLVRLCD